METWEEKKAAREALANEVQRSAQSLNMVIGASNTAKDRAWYTECNLQSAKRKAGEAETADQAAKVATTTAKRQARASRDAFDAAKLLSETRKREAAAAAAKMEKATDAVTKAKSEVEASESKRLREEQAHKEKQEALRKAQAEEREALAEKQKNEQVAQKAAYAAQKQAEAAEKVEKAKRAAEASDLTTPAGWDTEGCRYEIDEKGRWWWAEEGRPAFEISMGFRDRRYWLRFNDGMLECKSFPGEAFPRATYTPPDLDLPSVRRELKKGKGWVEIPADAKARDQCQARRETLCKPIKCDLAMKNGVWPYGKPTTPWFKADAHAELGFEDLNDNAMKWLLFLHMPELQGDPQWNKGQIEPRNFLPYPPRRAGLLADPKLRGLVPLMSMYGRRGFKEFMVNWINDQHLTIEKQHETKSRMTDMRDGKADLANAKKLSAWKREQENAEKATAARAKAEAQAEDGEDDEDEDAPADETKPELIHLKDWQQQLSYVYTMPEVQEHLAKRGNMTTMRAWRAFIEKNDLVPEHLKGKPWHLCHILARKLGGMVHPANLFLAPCKVNWHFRIYFCQEWELYVGPEAWKGAIAFNNYIVMRTGNARGHACAEYDADMRSSVHECD
jgi:hypothetical protein